MDLDAYRRDAESFLAAYTRVFYRHYSGLSADFPIEAVYDAHAHLFTRGAVEDLRGETGAAAPGGEPARRLRELLAFAVEGLLGQATRELDGELARREARINVDVEGARLGYREAAAAQAREPSRERRAELEAARNAVLAEQLKPLQRESLETQHALARELGWESYRAMVAQLRDLDLVPLAAQTEAFLAATATSYPSVLEHDVRRVLGLGLDELARADLAYFFRDPAAEARFPAAGLIEALNATLGGLGIRLDGTPGVVLDTAARATKSPRAFCAPVRVPGEIYLVIAPTGGVDDYRALFHEAGHTAHFAHVDPGLAFEFRQLGDNAVTEAFAFLFDHLIEDPAWLRARMDQAEAEAVCEHARAVRLVYLRRYCAKLAYELELHDRDGLAGADARYAALLSAAVGVRWPTESSLADVDPFFYSACYLRAWALETHLRALLRERFGAAWWEQAQAGELLRGLWARGQRLDAEELLGELTGAHLDFGAMVEDLGL